MLVTKKAPDFTACAVMPDNSFVENFNLYEFLKKTNKGAVLFFWPKDFTFVCPSEIIAYDNQVKEFREKGYELIGLSIDSEFVHLAWKNVPVEKGGIGQVQFPLVADLSKQIARDYDVLFNEQIALRATFVINKEGIVKHATINDLPIGRNVAETLRTVDAINHHEKYGEVCPANWKSGKKAMKASPDGVKEYLEKNHQDLK